MSYGLQEAIFSDLDNVTLREPQYLKCYLRDFVARTYMGTPTMEMTNISLYSSEKGLEVVKKQLRDLVYMGNQILDINKLFDNIVNEQFNVYCERKKIKQSNQEKDLNAAVLEEIQNLNLNAGYKEYLTNCFNEGNYRELEGLISDELFFKISSEFEISQSKSY